MSKSIIIKNGNHGLQKQLDTIFSRGILVLL